MKSTLKSLLPSLLFLAAAATFAAVGLNTSQPTRCMMKPPELKADACCVKPEAAQPVPTTHECCTNDAASPQS